MSRSSVNIHYFPYQIRTSPTLKVDGARQLVHFLALKIGLVCVELQFVDTYLQGFLQSEILAHVSPSPEFVLSKLDTLAL